MPHKQGIAVAYKDNILNVKNKKPGDLGGTSKNINHIANIKHIGILCSELVNLIRIFS